MNIMKACKSLIFSSDEGKDIKQRKFYTINDKQYTVAGFVWRKISQNISHLQKFYSQN